MMRQMPRTTLLLEDDALSTARAHARRHQLTLGEAVSDLVRQGAERPLVTQARNGFHVVRLGRRSPRVSARLVDQLLDDLP